jgi:hypothetical protein
MFRVAVLEEEGEGEGEVEMEMEMETKIKVVKIQYRNKGYHVRWLLASTPCAWEPNGLRR